MYWIIIDHMKVIYRLLMLMHKSERPNWREDNIKPRLFSFSDSLQNTLMMFQLKNTLLSCVPSCALPLMFSGLSMMKFPFQTTEKSTGSSLILMPSYRYCRETDKEFTTFCKHWSNVKLILCHWYVCMSYTLICQLLITTCSKRKKE